MLLASGLGLGSVSGEALLSTQLLVDVVTGQLGAEGEQSCAAHIARVILAGNLLSQNTQSRDTINKVWPGGAAASWCSWGVRGCGEGQRGCGVVPHCLAALPGQVPDQEDTGCKCGGCEDAG